VQRRIDTGSSIATSPSCTALRAKRKVWFSMLVVSRMNSASYSASFRKSLRWIISTAMPSDAPTDTNFFSVSGLDGGIFSAGSCSSAIQ